MREERFPLVSDDEVMLTEMPVMDLYDESDFISNIKGEYRDKNYLEWGPITEERPEKTIEKPVEKPKKASLGVKKEGKSYAEVAREEARADLKKKRSASYLTKDITPTRRHSQPSLVRQGNQPTAPFQKENPGELAKFSDKLAQNHYILAEMAPQMQQTTKEEHLGPKKNNYDFLKKSQIYNKKENQSEKERKIAQELNLTNMTE